MKHSRIFEDLFVLELANNHWGRIERGLQIVTDFSRIVRFNNVRAAIKLRLRNVEAFIHRDFRDRDDIRYIKKTLDTQLRKNDYARLVDAIRKGAAFRWQPPLMRFRSISVSNSVSTS
jgi:N-acetylneuraminate synthase